MFALFAALLFAVAVAAFTAPDGLCQFDKNAFSGGWYEIASSDFIGQTMENGCICPVAYYTTNSTDDNVIDLTNSCIRNGQFWNISGNLFDVVQDRPEGNLYAAVGPDASSYNGTQEANYIVLKLYYDNQNATAPQYALVGGDTENYWWLLSRSPGWNDTIWYNANYVLQGHEYNVTGYRVPEQTCRFLGGHGPNLISPEQI